MFNKQTSKGEYQELEIRKYIQVTFLIPHGSVLSFILFIIYLSNLPKTYHYLNVTMFADDLTVLIKTKSLSIF